ncbi:hypothetical protein PMAYCL1PPCAC_09583 [Pristionchus mayeri]|uniref:DNA2/NAM7 helicase-like C-terminal domain-containing protein n=1 Tax=Pristionchus mayeri TaxID=1317129 RepID=A0AAN4ZJ60_9BILA|nr:hypothetical protein PMAYCL1PPCAC_09583 [Pristionchus mayeri]
MAVSYCKEGGLQLLLSTANAPVFNIAEVLAKVDCGGRKIGHIISTEKKGSSSPFTVRVGLQADLRLVTMMRDWSEKRRIQEAIRDAYHDAYVATWSGCDVILGTVDMVLGKLLKLKDGRHCPIQEQLETRVRRIIIDEASQLPEAAFNTLALLFPQATIALIGDSQQLPPFKYEQDELVSDLAARPALSLVNCKINVPVTKLRVTYRQAPMLMPYNPVFYGGRLVSDKEPSIRVILSPVFGVSKDCLFVNVKASKTEQSDTSKINKKELSALINVIGKLNDAGYDHKSVMIIAYYEAQRKLAAERLPGYQVLTVDAAQGTEKDIVIVLTHRQKTGFFTLRNRSLSQMSTSTPSPSTAIKEY